MQVGSGCGVGPTGSGVMIGVGLATATGFDADGSGSDALGATRPTTRPIPITKIRTIPMTAGTSRPREPPPGTRVGLKSAVMSSRRSGRGSAQRSRVRPERGGGDRAGEAAEHPDLSLRGGAVIVGDRRHRLGVDLQGATLETTRYSRQRSGTPFN